jgi:hypothetical protein
MSKPVLPPGTSSASSALGPEFEKMASKYVGDGKTPNRFFVTVSGKVTALSGSKKAAIAAAQALGEHDRVIVEDRLEGEVWGNEMHHRLQRED